MTIKIKHPDFPPIEVDTQEELEMVVKLLRPKKKYNKFLSLCPLKFDDAISALLKVPKENPKMKVK